MPKRITLHDGCLLLEHMLTMGSPHLTEDEWRKEGEQQEMRVSTLPERHRDLCSLIITSVLCTSGMQARTCDQHKPLILQVQAVSFWLVVVFLLDILLLLLLLLILLLLCALSPSSPLMVSLFSLLQHSPYMIPPLLLSQVSHMLSPFPSHSACVCVCFFFCVCVYMCVCVCPSPPPFVSAKAQCTHPCCLLLMDFKRRISNNTIRCIYMCMSCTLTE